MGEGWQLLTIRGIPLRIHPSWFVILGVATVAFSQHYRLAITPTLAPPVLYGVALLTALLLFVSVLLHELGHSLVALSQGVQVRSITLFLLGGVASVDRECTTAIGALLVAAAGPAVSLLLAVALLLGIHPASHLSPVLGEMVQQLGLLNLVLALFNLLPGLPLDGGLIVKALVWQLTGSQRRGIEVANASGRALSFLAIGLGTLLLLRGSGIGGAWLILLGWFGLGASRNQQQLLLVQQALRELKVREAAQRRFRVLEAGMTLRELSRLRLDDGADPSAGPSSQTVSPEGTAQNSRSGAIPSGPADWLLVCKRGRWRGVIDDTPLRELPVQRWDQEPVERHLRPLDSLPMIREDAPLWQAVLALDEPGVSRLLVLNPAGLPSGTVERPEIGEAVLRRLGLRIPAPLLSSARRQGAYPLGLALPQVTRSMLSSGDIAQAPSEALSASSRS